MSDMPIMDPLKMAHGVKKPLTNKADKIKDLVSDQKRYYPLDQRGNVDEWGAVQKHRNEVHERMLMEAQIKKTLD